MESYSVQAFPLSIIPLRATQIGACINTLLLFIAEYYSIM